MLCRRNVERLKMMFHRWPSYSSRPWPRSIRKIMSIGIFIVIVVVIILSYQLKIIGNSRRRVNPPQPSITCRFDHFHKSLVKPKNHSSRDSRHISKRVLVLVESPYTSLAKHIITVLEAARIEYKIENTGRNLPTLTHFDKSKFGVIILENLEAYVNMDNWNRQLIDKYCRDYKVGMIIFVHSVDEYGIDREKVPGFPLILRYNMALKDYTLNLFSDIWRITRPGEIWEGTLQQDDWTVFDFNHSTYEPLAYAKAAPPPFLDAGYVMDNRTLVSVLQDRGTFDGIQKVFFGNGLKFWLHIPVLLDVLSYLSHGKLSLPLERHIQIDVDDIFVGITGTRMTPVDVEAVVQAQERLQQQVQGFKFNLGFSGWFYQHGNSQENEGDSKILEHRHKFWWFGHMWRHEQAHKFTQDHLERSMLLNYQFAKNHDIPIYQQYAVAPHHSGVYPVHEPLYQSWKNVWDIRVTSTEEYPRLYPAWRRRGFIHKGIMVLPRQTCGLFTHTLFLDKYPGGRHHLDNSIQGGELFQTFLFNPINIYMTHMGNYANDRLALYTFESVIKFVQCWTNLQLKQVPPLELGIKYFEMYPEERDPLWQNPCLYKRHLAIWSTNKSCDRLPKFLVIGPQKTGTTALYTFLSLHPAILSNYNSPDTFEEVQFFNGNNYYKGIDWYMEFFPIPPNATSDFLFEKSATYFDNELVPMRAHGLIPKAKLICILIHPAKRAYSWYQHIRAHNDPIALNYTFLEVVTADDSAPRKLRDLKNRCLAPGIYVQHLSRWLDYFPARQLFIIDGEWLKSHPVAVMHNVQRFLHIEPHYNYSQLIRFDPKKGFYCQILSEDKNKCLGRGKGRLYPNMSKEVTDYLRQFYRKHNVALSKFLKKNQYRIPDWLEEELSH
ncbi:bifunctional heparan sulfate N-deacetylase/N-sulfotransferase-like [Mizuhopecten yessoensis]|nr:bifunctional heparan sulfate N-deacetylase/N-sulfotransferase-like [Mizuhopecten yessoensis]XP_021350488.1 bifunctional heparan sulfate N-deacetylase/N-sulfotransferase-like [Mizuhopecten yessoensis]XP_021350489.1 bifunctional heparan sulfate N-deacetylase/N-sulfotransferase-like [Mizuhopecten yessoensis]